MTVLMCMPAHASSTETVTSTNTFILLVTGDVIAESSWAPPFKPAEKLFENFKQAFSSADCVMINLEEPITRHPKKTPFKKPASVKKGKDYILRATNLKLPRIFKESGIDVVNLANNHVGDYTSAGVTETLKGLEAAGLLTVGAGKDRSHAYRFGKKEANGVKVAFLGFTDIFPEGFEATRRRPGIAVSRNEAAARKAVERAQEWGDFVVVMVHWGDHATSTVTARQMDLGRKLIDWGADAVAGMHAHFLQGIEVYNKRPIFYGLGNFAFPGRRQESRKTVLLELAFKKGEAPLARLTPVLISPEGQPRIVDGAAESEDIFLRLNELCGQFGSGVSDGVLVH